MFIEFQIGNRTVGETTAKNPFSVRAQNRISRIAERLAGTYAGQQVDIVYHTHPEQHDPRLCGQCAEESYR
jgi:hypothetical protein